MPKKNLAAYRRMAMKAEKVWHKHGALDYKECAGDDLKVKMELQAHRDRVNARVMKDPEIQNLCDLKKMPFDAKRMAPTVDSRSSCA